jgi:hypothetical protein
MRSTATATKSAMGGAISRGFGNFAPEAIFGVADAANSRSEICELDRSAGTG